MYEIISPETESDGISEMKHVTGYSYEKTLEYKKFFIEEGTFNFWNPVEPADTVLGRILEIAIGWSAGYVSPSLIGRYRTFDSYDDYLLSFVYNRAPEKYRCVFVFDTYQRTINVYDADEEISNLPIYLDFDNLLESVSVSEKSDELVTAIRHTVQTSLIYELSIQSARTGFMTYPTSFQTEISPVRWQKSGRGGSRALSTGRCTIRVWCHYRHPPTLVCCLSRQS